jgi:uncharacterized protein
MAMMATMAMIDSGSTRGTQCVPAPAPAAALRLALLLAALAALLGASWPARAGNGYPDPIAPRVNDFAHILSDSDVGRLHDRFAQLDRERGIKVAVVTINSIGDYPAGSQGFERFCTGLFNDWGVGDRARNNGALLLVAVRDRKVRIELGKAYGRSRDGQVSQIIQRDIIPQFRRADYRAGVLNGAESLARVLSAINSSSSVPRRSAPPAAQPATPAQASSPAAAPAPDAQPMVEMPTAASNPAEAPSAAVAPRAAVPLPVRHYPSAPSPVRYYPQPSGFNRGFNPTFIVIIIMFGGFVAMIAGVKLILGNRPRLCPHCGRQMQLLDEFADDMFLDSGQKLEERLSSVNYEVRKCPGCGMHTIERRGRWFTSYSACPSCHYKTMREDCETIEHPTYHSTGRKLVTHNCQNCGYVYQDTIVIPMLQRSDDSCHHSSFTSSSSFSSGSSGGGSSFGGGSSSGGGASGSW